MSHLLALAGVFPARAGMSRIKAEGCSMRECFPRASGDEPAAIMSLGLTDVFSPRERG